MRTVSRIGRATGRRCPIAWQLQKAKQRLSEVVRAAIESGPQLVTRHGKAAAVVVSAGDFERLRQGHPGFKEFLRQAPELERLEIDPRGRPSARKGTA